jgi:hypothetical protein
MYLLLVGVLHPPREETRGLHTGLAPEMRMLRMPRATYPLGCISEACVCSDDGMGPWTIAEAVSSFLFIFSFPMCARAWAGEQLRGKVVMNMGVLMCGVGPMLSLGAGSASDRVVPHGGHPSDCGDRRQ